MRPLEILISVTLVVYFIVLLLHKRRPRWLNFLPLLAIVLVLLHLLIEGYRWQMVPLYFLVTITGLLSVIHLTHIGKSETELNSFWRIWDLLSLIFLVLGTALPALMPIPKVPPPNGPYKVGTLSMTMTDYSRQEIYGNNPIGPRAVMVQLWYPAEPKPGDQKAPWMEDSHIVSRALSKWLELPSFTLDHLQYARANAYQDAHLNSKDAPYPLLLFSHGWGGFRAQNTHQMEELASHGYIVAAVEHPYSAAITVFPDGSIAEHDPNTLPDEGTLSERIQAGNRLINQWSGDLTFVLNSLEQINTSDPDGRFTRSLDLSRVGALGHSTGGGAVIDFCSADNRCRAVMGMDPYVMPLPDEVLKNGINQPALMLFSEEWPAEANTQRINRLLSNSTDDVKNLTILGTDHYDFTDLPMLSPLAPYIGLKGPRNASDVVSILRDFTTSFFNSVFLDKNPVWLEVLVGKYPEIRISTE